MIMPVVVFEVLCDGCQVEKSAPRAQDYWGVGEMRVDFEESLELNGWARNRAGTRHWCCSCVGDGYAADYVEP